MRAVVYADTCIVEFSSLRTSMRAHIYISSLRPHTLVAGREEDIVRVKLRVKLEFSSLRTMRAHI